eukprot:s352_g22.t1
MLEFDHLFADRRRSNSLRDFRSRLLDALDNRRTFPCLLFGNCQVLLEAYWAALKHKDGHDNLAVLLSDCQNACSLDSDFLTVLASPSFMSHTRTERGLRLPSSPSETFQQLKEGHILPPDSKDTPENLRNISNQQGFLIYKLRLFFDVGSDPSTSGGLSVANRLRLLLDMESEWPQSRVLWSNLFFHSPQRMVTLLAYLLTDEDHCKVMQCTFVRKWTGRSISELSLCRGQRGQRDMAVDGYKTSEPTVEEWQQTVDELKQVDQTIEELREELRQFEVRRNLIAGREALLRQRLAAMGQVLTPTGAASTRGTLKAYEAYQVTKSDARVTRGRHLDAI